MTSRVGRLRHHSDLRRRQGRTNCESRRVSAPNSLGVIEIVPTVSFYDYEAKYAQGGSRHILPAEIAPKVYEETRRLTLAAHQALGCRGVSRADFRYDDRCESAAGLYCLEVNTQPGMTETSLVPELAAHAGVSFAELVQWMVEDASINRECGS